MNFCIFFVSYSILLYLIVFYCILFYLIVSYYILLYLIVSYCILLYFIVSYCILLYLIVSYYFLLYLIVSYFILLYLIVIVNIFCWFWKISQFILEFVKQMKKIVANFLFFFKIIFANILGSIFYPNQKLIFSSGMTVL